MPNRLAYDSFCAPNVLDRQIPNWLDHGFNPHRVLLDVETMWLLSCLKTNLGASIVGSSAMRIALPYM
jgi:hypothetical protein